ncbi:hypothetical protein [Halorussus caseinilyticus]|uniref:Uncharacterized protein n=1 Tax=Halorussus caseinilyticus TaxID=3034025 RepID=A0ABD5WLS5_9EURY
MRWTKTVSAVVLALAVSVGGLGAFWTPVASASHQSVTIDSPSEGDQYFVGEAVSINGTANGSVGSVALYARASGDWLLLDVNQDGVRDGSDTLTVDTDGSWSVRNLVLADSNPILSYPGNYQPGAVDAAEVGENGSVPSSLPANRLLEAGGAQSSLRIERARLEGAS